MKERRDVTRTKNAIERAYLELLFKKGYSKITVNEVINLADVSRGTFYAHYRDIPDLEEKVEERFIQELKGACEGSDLPDKGNMTYRERLERVFDRFYIFKDHFTELIMAENNAKMMNKIRWFLVSAIESSETKDKVVERLGQAKAEMIFNIMAAGFVAAFEYHIRHENEVGRDETIELMCDIINGEIKRVMDDMA